MLAGKKLQHLRLHEICDREVCTYYIESIVRVQNPANAVINAPKVIEIPDSQSAVCKLMTC
jgi:hypothetical protein